MKTGRDRSTASLNYGTKLIDFISDDDFVRSLKLH